MTTYRLGSSPMINTPGILKWAQNGYHFKKDLKHLLNVFVTGWTGENAPTPEIFDRLLKGEIPHTIEHDAVVFTA